MAKEKLNQKEQLLRRIKTIRGHLAAVERMIEDERPSDEILLQLSATRSAIHHVSILEAQRNVQNTLRETIELGKNHEGVNEAIRKLMDLKQDTIYLPVPRKSQMIV